ncbi:GH3 auxin-responsive promoter family protein [Bdellovibrio sp. NC01]|uniref:GH3 family domain-containing protein n=1 Tax=Bdellovibrio sp. NC01 TaxID=2220073 RepID=UPI00115A7943|nr:GH3 auxin-responsive promoter family protein [Bdellovibrio sp. NC01]QDK38632.1 hypothetical protein DOE51_14100 [Bdellovibrio sp. NC01]
MIRRLCHELLQVYYARSEKTFRRSLGSLEAIQRKKLADIITSLQNTTEWKHLSASLSYEELSKSVSVKSYQDYAALIERQRANGENIISSEVVRYEPTSGSTDQRKWIPYTRVFLNEINQAAQVWLGDLYKRIPAIKSGTHYWSLSWLPQELRGLTNSNDADLFPAYQRWILNQLMAVPSEIATLQSSEAAWWATLLYLAAQKDLSLVSVWSPTFWLKVSEDIQNNWSEICSALHNGEWNKFSTELAAHLGKAPVRDVTDLNPDDSEFFVKLWPKLQLLSSWDSSSSALWADKLKSRFPNVNFQGKGLWATEGVVTIPYQKQKCLAFHSHFFEFRNLATGNIVPAWQLQKGEEYQPILWTSSGLLRYPLQDRLRVTGFLQSVPCFEFVSRLRSVDLVGEKMDAAWVQDLFANHPEWQAVSLVGVRLPKPQYILFGQNVANVDIEKSLLKVHHYQVARQLGQLQPAKAVEVQDIFNFLKQFGSSRLAGQNKIEVLFSIDALSD